MANKEKKLPLLSSFSNVRKTSPEQILERMPGNSFVEKLDSLKGSFLVSEKEERELLLEASRSRAVKETVVVPVVESDEPKKAPRGRRKKEEGQEDSEDLMSDENTEE